MDDAKAHWPQGRDTENGMEGAQRLAAIRKEIDSVDLELLRLFNRRADLSLEVGRIKATEPGIIFKPLREREVLDGLAAKNPGPLPEEHLRAIWREIFSSSRALQRPQNVAYLGPEGTFSYFAGVEYLGHAASFHPCGDITQIFEEVSSGQCELGVVPLENSLQGTVGVSFDLFLKHEVFIQAELFSRISHCLLSNAPAIGHGKLADMLGLGVLARRIEDEPGNWTRFVIIGPKSAQPGQSGTAPRPMPGHTGADKTSLLFTLPDKAGSLSTVLDLLAGNDINMRKLESRPLRGQCWKYVFFADVESDLEDPRHAALLERLRNACTSFRILGSYPTGPQLDRMSLSGDDASDEQGM